MMVGKPPVKIGEAYTLIGRSVNKLSGKKHIYGKASNTKLLNENFRSSFLFVKKLSRKVISNT